MRHKPRFHSADLGGWHHHQGDDARYADDDCPHCRQMYLEEAAPDLLAACEEYLEAKRSGVILSTGDKPNEYRAHEMIAAAVAKAKGGA